MNLHLRVTSWTYEPFSKIVYKDGKSKQVGGCLLPILEEITERLNASSEIIRPPNRPEWGLRLLNKTWTGAIGLLLSNKAEIALAPYSFSRERYEVVDYGPVLSVSGDSILTREWSLTTNNDLLESLANFIDGKVFFLVLVFLILLPLLIQLLILLSDQIRINKHRKTNKIEDSSIFFGRLYINFLRPLLQQGSMPQDIYKSPSVRIILSAFFIAAAVLVIKISSLIKVDVVVEEGSDLIDSLEDLARNERFCPLIRDTSTISKVFKTAKSGPYKEVWRRTLQCKGLLKPWVAVNGQYPPRLVTTDRNALITAKAAMVAIGRHACNAYPDAVLHVAKESFVGTPVAIIWRKTLDPKLKKKLWTILTAMVESGIFQRNKKVAEGSKVLCFSEYALASSSVSQSASRAAHLMSLRTTFQVWSIGMALSVAVLIGELIFTCFVKKENLFTRLRRRKEKKSQVKKLRRQDLCAEDGLTARINVHPKPIQQKQIIPQSQTHHININLQPKKNSFQKEIFKKSASDLLITH